MSEELNKPPPPEVPERSASADEFFSVGVPLHAVRPGYIMRKADDDLFDAALGGSRFLAGETFSIADITFAVALQFAQMVKLDLPFDLPNIARYLDEVGSRQSFQDS